MDCDTLHGFYVILDPQLEHYQVVGLAYIYVGWVTVCYCSCLKYEIK